MEEAAQDYDIEANIGDTLERLKRNLKAVNGFLEKGSGLTKYTVYLVRGEDKDGPFQVYRRFSEFYALRDVLLQRWPGCFVPAVPDKKVIGKNDDMIKKNRERFLDSFVKKIGTLPHLYYSQQFQLLLRSKDSNITDTYEKYSKPSYEDIINRYKQNFSQLQGKQIGNQTAVKISSFYSFLQSSQNVLSGYKDMAKRLAIQRSVLDRKLSNIFTRSLPDYEKVCLTQYVGYDDSKTIIINPNNTKFAEQSQAIATLCNKNPYWLIYDLIKYEDRDGEAFLAAIESRTKLEGKRTDIENKIRDNKRQIEEISMGNTTVKSFFSAGTKDNQKVKLEREIQQYQKDKVNLVSVIDIITALLSYITIDHYREYKKRYYGKIFKTVSNYEIGLIQNMYDIWNNCLTQSCKFTGQTNDVESLYPQLSNLRSSSFKKQNKFKPQQPQFPQEPTNQQIDIAIDTSTNKHEQEQNTYQQNQQRKDSQNYDE